MNIVKPIWSNTPDNHIGYLVLLDDNSNIINNLCLKEKEFVLVTAHRSENVDNFESLSND